MITKERIEEAESYACLIANISRFENIGETFLELIAEWRARQEPVKELVCRHCKRTADKHYGGMLNCSPLATIPDTKFEP